MASLLDLWRAVLPAARPVGSGTAFDAAGAEARAAGREVGWVRVLQARVPAFVALDPQDLAILPEPALAALTAAGAIDPPTLVEAIATAGAAAVVLLGDEPLRGPLAIAAERAERLGLPALFMAASDGVLLERAVIGFLLDARGELERQAGRLEAELERLALADAGLEAQAAAVASFLGAGVAIEGPGGEPLAVHAAPARTETRSDAARYLAHPERVSLRVRLADLGSLAILGDGPPSELQRVVTARVAGLLALSIGRERASRAGPAGRDRAEALPAGGPPWVVLMARQLVPGLEASGAEREAARERLRRLAPARRLLLRGDISSLEYRLALAPEARDPFGLTVGARMATLLERAVAVSRPFADPGQRALAEAEARATLETFEALGRPPQVARADRLPAYRLLGNLHNLPAGRRQAEELLAPLLTGRPSAQARRLDTLRAVLDAPDLVQAAARLGVHRNTLTYRLSRIEAQTGWQLDEPDLKFLLGLSLRLMHDAQTLAAEEPSPR